MTHCTMHGRSITDDNVLCMKYPILQVGIISLNNTVAKHSVLCLVGTGFPTQSWLPLRASYLGLSGYTLFFVTKFTLVSVRISGYMLLDIWQRTTLTVREKICCTTIWTILCEMSQWVHHEGLIR